MSQTETTVPAPESEPSTTLGLGGPVPQPGPTGPVPIAIPTDGDPADVAKQLLEAAIPSAPAVLAARIEAIGRQIEDSIEQYRLSPKLGFAEFLPHAINRVKLRRALQARAGTPTDGSAASEVLAIVTSVRRWRPAEEFRRERARRLEAIRLELDRVEGRIRHTLDSARAGSGFAVSDPEAAGSGFNHDHDEVLRRLQKALESRKAVRDRLARLDSHGDGGRSQAVRQAIDSAGGIDALVGALAPRMHGMPAESALEKLRLDMDGIAGQLEVIDPETRLATELTARLAGLDAQIPGLQSAIKQQKGEAAGALVSAAIGGTLSGIQSLESAVPFRPELAAALNAIRASDDDLVNVVAELIG
jgi:hypothetical protein